MNEMLLDIKNIAFYFVVCSLFTIFATKGNEHRIRAVGEE